jgi:hypothetical protein
MPLILGQSGLLTGILVNAKIYRWGRHFEVVARPWWQPTPCTQVIEMLMNTPHYQTMTECPSLISFDTPETV